MSESQVKRYRWVIKKAKRDQARDMIHEILNMPFTKRLWFAWFILKGKTKNAGATQ